MTAHLLSEHHHPRTRGGNWKGKQDLGERATSVHSTDAAPHPSKQPQGPRKPPLVSHGHLDTGAPVPCCPGPPATPWRGPDCHVRQAHRQLCKAHRPQPEATRAQDVPGAGGQVILLFSQQRGSLADPLRPPSAMQLCQDRRVSRHRDTICQEMLSVSGTLWVTQTVLVAQSRPSL